jgi:hypothetical protein
MIFTNPQEKVIYSFTGSMSVTELINKGKIALTNQDDFDQLKVKYLKDELNKDDLYRYLMIVKMKGSSKDLNEVLDKYVILNPVIDSNMFNTISGNLEYTVTPAFIFLEKNRDEFARLVGRDKVEELIRRLYTKGIGLKAFKDEEDYITTISELNQKICLTEKEQLIIASDHYYQVRDSKNFMAATAALATKYYQNDDEALSLKIGSSFGFNLDQNDLLTVKSWAERAISLKNNTVNALSLAMVYFNLKNKEQALKYINIAFENSLRDKDNEEGHLAVFKKQIEEGKY